MVAELKKERFLHQHVAAYEIHQRFGEEFVKYNQQGNMAIEKAVLDKFKKLTGNLVVWDRSERLWRYREEHDAAGRQQE